MADSTPFQMTDEPLQIFNDQFSASFPSDSCPTPPPMVNHAPMPSVIARQRRCLQPAESSGGTAPNAPSPLAATHAAAAAAAAASASSATSAAAAHPPPSHKMAPSTSRPKTGSTNTPGAAPLLTSFFSTSSRSSSTSAPLQTIPADRLNSITMAPPSGPRSVTDSIPKKTDGSASSAANLAKQKNPSGRSAVLYGKENPHQTLCPAPNPIFSLSFDSESHKLASAAGAVAAGISAPKRVLLDAAPITEDKPATATKKTKADDSAAIFPLPSHDSFPHIMDDGTKPSHSYAQLIGMAILRSPNRRLTLSQIYKWISDHYSFYNPTDAGWQNSIRHNLSLHKNFIKIERPKDDPGKGNYWIIEPGTEMQFMREKTTRKASAAAENVAVMSTRPEPRSTRPLPNPSSTPVSGPCRSPMFGRPQPVLPSSSASSLSSTLPPQQRQHSLPPLPSSSSSQPGMMNNIAGPAELSSDATIPLSDPPGAEAEPPADHHLGLLQLQHADSGSYEPGLFSPIPAAMQSSPPIPRHAEPARHGTPPPSARLGASSGASGGGGAGASRASHKRKYPSVDDSGYLSSLESSALRPGQIRSGLLTSEPDRPRIKRGRAEEEIARLRGSSYDSPTKSRGWAAAAGDLAPPSSSPLRNDSQAGQMLPPLTPAVKIKPAIMRPPPSVSPNTTLQMHRDQVSRMLGSPARRYNGGLGEDVIPWSPAFNLDSMAGYGGYGDCAPADPDFSIFQDMDEDPFGLGPGGHGSPVKKSVVAGAPPAAKRARLDRSQSTSALSDITGGGGNSRPCRPPMAAAAMSSKFQTPTKMPMQHQQQQHQHLQQQPPQQYNNPAGRLFSPSPSKLSAVMTGDQNWTGLEFGDFLVSEHLAEYQGFDILQGFEKIGSIGAAQQQQQQQPLQHMHSLLPQQQPQQNQPQQQQTSANPGGPRAPSKPSLSRSFSTAF